MASSKDIKLNIGLEDNTFRQAIKDCNAELKTLNQTAKELSKNDSGSGLEKSLQNAEKRADALNQKLDTQKNHLKKLEQFQEELNKEMQKVDKGSTAYKELETALESNERAMKKLRNEIDLTEAQFDSVQSECKQLENKIDSLGDSADSTTADVKEMNNALDTIKSHVGSINKMQLGQSLINGGQAILNGLQRVGEGFISLIEKGAEYDASMAQIEMQYNNLSSSTQSVIDSQTELASTWGLTTNSVKSGAVELASYYSAMGLADEQINELLPSQLQLIADMMAFCDVPFDEALADYKSALMGNHEAVDKYGIAIAESTINESEYAKSIGKTCAEMTEEEKILARQSVMMQQSASYTGLAGEEADSATSKIRLMKEQLELTAGTIGQALLPVIEPLVAKVTEVAQKFAEWAEKNPDLVEKLGQVALIIGTLIGVIGTFVIIMGTISVVMGAVSAVATAFGISMGVAFGWITVIVVAITALIAGLIALYLNWDSVCAWVTEKWGAFCDWISTTFEQLKTWVVDTFQYICDNIPVWWGNFCDWIKNLWDSLVQWVCDKATQIKDWVVRKFKELVEKATTFFEELPYNIGYITGTIIRKIIEWSTNMVNKAKEMGSNFLKRVVEFFKQLPGKIWEFCVNTYNKVQTWKEQMKQKAIEVGKDFLTKVVEFIKQLPGKLWEWLKNVITKVQTFKTQMKQKAIEAGKEFLTGLVNKLKEIPSKVYSIGKSIVDSIKNGISNAWSGLVSTVQGWIDGLIDGLNPFKDSDTIVRQVAFEYDTSGNPTNLYNYGKSFTDSVNQLGYGLKDSDVRTLSLNDIQTGYTNAYSLQSQDFNSTFNRNLVGQSVASPKSKTERLDEETRDKEITVNINIDQMGIGTTKEEVRKLVKMIEQEIKLHSKKW